VLARVSGLASDIVADLLDEAVRARVVVLNNVARIAHDLFREAILAALLSARRTELHAAVGLALQDLAGGPTTHDLAAVGGAAALAAHFVALRVAEQIEHRQWTIGALWSLGTLYLGLLAPERATPVLERAFALAVELASEMWTPLVASVLALAHLQHGRLADAHAVLGRVLGPNSPFEVMSTRQAWAARAELALAQRDSTTALRILDRLLETVPGDRIVPRLWLLHGRALQLQGSARDAKEVLAAAEASAAQAGIRPLLLHVRAALARLLRAGGRRDEADAQIQLALHLVDELAADIPEPSLRETFTSRARSLLPRQRAVSERRIAKAAAGGLTAREREVARLIAAGSSNRAIAIALVLGERTVEGHVSSILNKLGFNSRAQIAVWAAAHNT
jgi:DNA-binding NarL/FixJ family response regulator